MSNNYKFSKEWQIITLCAKIAKKKKTAAQSQKNDGVRAYVKKKV